MSELSSLSLVPAVDLPSANNGVNAGGFTAWRASVRDGVLLHVSEFVSARTAELDRAGIDAAGDILLKFVSGGKCLRSAFMYMGWLCGEAADDAALRAAASLELLHAFALLQDDVMDESPQRRGRPAAHIQFAAWHRAKSLSSSPRRFGESAAILLGDLCLIWAEQMLRECGMDLPRLQQVWPRYDAMRVELAVGQFADLTSDIRDQPSLESVLIVARRKSGNYTVRRPLEIGAAMAGCDSYTVSQLGRYGAAVGEAFQLRDDLLGVFGSSARTGKPDGGDLLERKATSVMVTAQQMADPPTRRELTELMSSDHLDDSLLNRWKTLIATTGAVQRIEEMISEHLASAQKALADMAIDEALREALANMATACTERDE